MEFKNSRYILKLVFKLSTTTFETNSLNIIRYSEKRFYDFLKKDKSNWFFL